MANKESSFEPPADLLTSAKKATWNYNKEHQGPESQHVQETSVFRRYDVISAFFDFRMVMNGSG